MTLVRLTLISLLIGAGIDGVQAQERVADTSRAVPDTVTQRVTDAFAEGNVQRLLTPAANRVEVSLFGTRTVYSNAQAFYVLRDFFETHPPSGFSLGDVTGTGTSYFVQGRLSHTRSDQPLQVYVRLVRHDEPAWQVREVRVDAGAE